MFHDCVKCGNNARFLGVITSLGLWPYRIGSPNQSFTRPRLPHTFDFHEAMTPRCRAASPRATEHTSPIQPPREPRAAPVGRHHTTTLPGRAVDGQQRKRTRPLHKSHIISHGQFSRRPEIVAIPDYRSRTWCLSSGFRLGLRAKVAVI